TGKQPVVELDEGDEKEDMETRRLNIHGTHKEEILLAEAWIEHSQDNNIGKDQRDEIYWNKIVEDFHYRTTGPANRKSWENEADLIETVKTVYLERVFGPDKRERPAGKQRVGKKQKLVETSGSTGGSQSKSVSSVVSQDYRSKCDPAERAYEAQREKDLSIKKCKEMRFLMIDTSNLPPHKRAFIERQQAEIMRKYQDAGADDAGADDWDQVAPPKKKKKSGRKLLSKMMETGESCDEENLCDWRFYDEVYEGLIAKKTRTLAGRREAQDGLSVQDWMRQRTGLTLSSIIFDKRINGYID
ncbi:hypothetical protein Tco_0417712, partial [Tanacetum coccineum]